MSQQGLLGNANVLVRNNGALCVDIDPFWTDMPASYLEYDVTKVCEHLYFCVNMNE